MPFSLVNKSALPLGEGFKVRAGTFARGLLSRSATPNLQRGEMRSCPQCLNFWTIERNLSLHERFSPNFLTIFASTA